MEDQVCPWVCLEYLVLVAVCLKSLVVEVVVIVEFPISLMDVRQTLDTLFSFCSSL